MLRLMVFNPETGCYDRRRLKDCGPEHPVYYDDGCGQWRFNPACSWTPEQRKREAEWFFGRDFAATVSDVAVDTCDRVSDCIEP